MAKEKKYFYILQGVGNPDFQQYADVAPKKVGKDTIKNIKEIVLKYIEDWNLGSGNFVGKIEGDLYISYNGRIWDKNDKEVVL